MKAKIRFFIAIGLLFSTLLTEGLIALNQTMQTSLGNGNLKPVALGAEFLEPAQCPQ